MISAGCENEPAETGTGSSGGNENTADHERAVKFAECMRDNAVGAGAPLRCRGRFGASSTQGVRYRADPPTVEEIVL